MKRIYALALALVSLTAAHAQDVVLTVAKGTNAVTVTLPEGEYTVNDEAVTSNGDEMTIELNGATEVKFKKADGTKVTAFKAVNQEGVIGMSGSGTGIVELDLHGNNISDFKYQPSVTKGTLKVLCLNDNALSSVSFSGSRWNALEVLDVSNNNLSTLGVSAMTSLKQLYCSNNNISTLTVTACTGLTTLWCDDNSIKKLDLSKCPDIESLVADNNALTAITAPSAGFTKMVDLWFSNNLVTSAAMAGSSVLNTVNVANNNLSSIELSATDKKILFADFSGNKLTFSSLYSPSDITNYMYGNQQKFGFEKDVYVHGETVDMPEMNATNLSGKKLKLSTKWYNWETDATLNQGSKTGSSGDFYAVTANKQYIFKPNFKGRTYATISTSVMPDLVMRSHSIRVIGAEDVDGVKELEAAGFTFDIVPGALRMSSQKPIVVRVVDVNGRVVWSGSVDSHGVQVDGLNGAYIVNGVKIAI